MFIGCNIIRAHHLVSVDIMVLYTESDLIGGSSHPVSPNLGITTIAPSLFLNGFEKEHNDLPRLDSHAALILVRPGHR